MSKVHKLLLSVLAVTCGAIMILEAPRNDDPFRDLIRRLNQMASRGERPPKRVYQQTHMSFFNDPFFADQQDLGTFIRQLFNDSDRNNNDEGYTTYIIQTNNDGDDGEENQEKNAVTPPQATPKAPPAHTQQPQPRRATPFNGSFPLIGNQQGQVDPRFGFSGPGQQDFSQYNPEEDKDKVTFKDVLGQNSAIQEVSQVVDFLKNPKKYHELGAEIPKGILLEGPPGCGKTLLARAVAGESGCTFVYATGSSFINKYVGTGADNLRKLFDQARSQAPAIVFIDEIDAIGSREGDENQEYRNTINQLLSLMDGFKKEDNIIVIAATNFVKNLDSALTRPGRFDRVVKVGLPNKNGREAILRYYFEKIKLAHSTGASSLAKEFATRTPGFSGADCKKLANEAALEACAENANQVSKKHCEQAYDKITLGLKNNFDRTKEQLWQTAVHEAGHAYVKRKKGLSVPKVTILSRGDALGATFSKEKYETFSDYRKDELFDKIMVLQAGAAAEKVILESKRPGACSDHQQAYNIASAMVREFGMGDGETDGLRYDKDMSELWKGKFDAEIANIIQKSRVKTEKLVSDNKQVVEKLARALHEKETMTEEEIDKAIGLR
ncbi:AAA family ATPase [Candidatus Dependentiae bacterium]|nr:AAA family ATPase [Candidatus Dependentiae bacterium]